MPPIPPGNMNQLKTLADARVEAARDAVGRGRALREQPVAPRPRLDDQVAGRVARAPRPEEEVVLRVEPFDSGVVDLRARAERLAAHADGVDLVDEDDALAAPLAGEPLRLASEEPHDDRVDADERRREARSPASR